MPLSKRAAAELLGTFWLVLPMAYALGNISRYHLNPAVSIGLATARRFPANELPAYLGSQLARAIVAAAYSWLGDER